LNFSLISIARLPLWIGFDIPRLGDSGAGPG
jgi:hypothetical protein